MEWISVKDKLPEEDRHVLVTNGSIMGVRSLQDTGDYPFWYCPSISYWDGEDEFNESGITHWMPLPEPPQ